MAAMSAVCLHAVPAVPATAVVSRGQCAEETTVQSSSSAPAAAPMYAQASRAQVSRRQAVASAATVALAAFFAASPEAQAVGAFGKKKGKAAPEPVAEEVVAAAPAAAPVAATPVAAEAVGSEIGFFGRRKGKPASAAAAAPAFAAGAAAGAASVSLPSLSVGSPDSLSQAIAVLGLEVVAVAGGSALVKGFLAE